MSENKRSTHIAYTVREYQDPEGQKQGRWLEIGAAWPHRAGKGFDLSLDAMPINGRVVLRVPEPKAAGDDDA